MVLPNVSRNSEFLARLFTNILDLVADNFRLACCAPRENRFQPLGEGGLG